MSKSRSLTTQAFGGLAWAFSGSAVTAVLQVVVISILARLVSPAEFGVVAAALVVIKFSAVLSELGVGPALVQRPELEPRHIKAAFTLCWAASVVFVVALWFGAPLISQFFSMPELVTVTRALSAFFVFNLLGVVGQALMQRELRFRALAARDIGSYALGFGLVAVIAGLNGYGVWSLVLGYSAQALIRSITVLLPYRHQLGFCLPGGAFKELLYFGGGFTVAKFANYLASQGDNLVIGRWLGAESLGLYGRAYQFLMVPAMVFGKVTDKVLFPVMAKVQADSRKLAVAYRRTVAVTALLVLPVSAVSFVVAPELVFVALGPDWMDVVLPFRVLACGMLFRTTYKTSDTLARATGVVYRHAARQVLYAFLVFGGALVGQQWGIVGVAGGVLIAITLHYLFMAHLSLAVAGLTWRDLVVAQLPALGLAVVCCGVTILLTTFAHRTTMHPIFILLGTFGGCTVAAVLAWRVSPGMFLGPDGRWLIQRLTGYMPSRMRALVNGALGTR